LVATMTVFNLCAKNTGRDWPIRYSPPLPTPHLTLARRREPFAHYLFAL
jgi:hypothetical protein